MRGNVNSNSQVSDRYSWLDGNTISWGRKHCRNVLEKWVEREEIQYKTCTLSFHETSREMLSERLAICGLELR